jgi:hypothetical protein
MDDLSFANAGDTIFVGTGYGIYRSIDNGASWNDFNNGLDNENEICALAVNNGYLFAGTPHPVQDINPNYLLGVYRTMDTGASWSNVLSDVPVYSLGVANGDIFVGAGGGGIPRSTDNGVSWSYVNTGLTNGFGHAFIATGGNLLVGTSGGVFVTSNTDTSWIAENSGLTQLTILSFGVSNGYLYAGSDSGFVWRRSLSEMTAVQYPQFPQQQNKADVRIDNGNILRYALSKESNVSFKIYNIQGRLLLASAQQKETAGFHSVPLAVERYAPGNYIIDFAAGDFRIQRRFTITH